MSEALIDLVRFRGDKLFNGAVNIDWFGTDEIRTRSASDAFVFHGPQYHGVSQADVGTMHGHRLADTATFALSVVRRCYGIEDQPFTLAIAGYGTGKSHLGLTLASVLSNPTSHTALTALASIEAADQAIAGEIRAILQEANQPCLVIALNGMKSFDLATEVTKQIVQQLKSHHLDTGPLDDLRPRFSQASSLIRMANDEVKAELITACDVTSIDYVLTGLEEQDESVYRIVHDVFSSRGMMIAALRGESVRDIIDVTGREYCGVSKTFRSLLILFDEFGRYTEFATVRSQIAGSGVLQDLFEGIQANNSVSCFVGFIQFELNAYVQRVAPEYKNEILRYVTRYQSAGRSYLSINLETLIANLLEKRRTQELDRWFDGMGAESESADVARKLALWFPQARNHRLWTDASQFHQIVRKGCWPLSAFSVWFLFYLASAGKHLQERSALALLGQVFDRFSSVPIPSEGGWSLSPVDFWSEALQQELISSEESGQQGAITHAYASVESRHGASLPAELIRLLRAIVVASKLGLQVMDREDAAEALAQLAGVRGYDSKGGLSALQDEYNVIEWDEAFKQFDILGDAVPRTQFLSYIRQRVASTYDEKGKSALFASRGSAWCDLLSDLECDFAESHKISTREWRYQAVTSNLDNLAMHVKLASDRWHRAISVDDPRGTIVYCYVEAARDMTSVGRDVARILRAVSNEPSAGTVPILTVLLHDEAGSLGQALAELAVLEESVSQEDRLKFGNLIPAHAEKLRQTVRSHVEEMMKQRHYVTALKEGLEAQRLGKAGTELFGRIYRSPLTFPFDGFSTAKGNAADSCQELTRDLLLAKLDYDAVLVKPVKIKNRAMGVLKDNWGIFSKTGVVMNRPTHPVVRNITTKWDELLSSGEQRLSVEQALRSLCRAPNGANIASAGLMLGVFVAARAEKLVVLRGSQQYSVSQLVQEGIFNGKYLDLNALRDIYFVTLGEGSSEWDLLLEEWEQAKSYLSKIDCLNRSFSLKERVPVPQGLSYREIHLREQSSVASQKLSEMEQKHDQAFKKMESGHRNDDVSIIAWGAAMLQDLCESMEREGHLWEDHQVTELRPHVERSKQEVTLLFANWLQRQSPQGDTLDAVGEFKRRMIGQMGGSLKKLKLTALSDELTRHVNHSVKNAETAAEARQLVRDVRSWIVAHTEAVRVVRVADGRALLGQGKDYTANLQSMSRKIAMLELGEARTQLSKFTEQLKEAVDRIVARLEQIWNLSIESDDDLDHCLSEVESLITAFENCPKDLEDLQLMRRALRLYREDNKQLANDRLNWHEFEALAQKLKDEAEQVISDDDVPWAPSAVISQFTLNASKRRMAASAEWIEALEVVVSDVASLSAPAANQLHQRASTPPPVLTMLHRERLDQLLGMIENRLDVLRIDWLVERFKELSPALKKKFLEHVEGL